MSQKLSVNVFEWVENISEFDKKFYKSYNEESDEGYFFEIDVQYPKNLQNFYNDLPVLPEIIKIETIESLLLIYMIKLNMLIHIRNLKQGLNHELVLKMIHRLITFNEKA